MVLPELTGGQGGVAQLLIHQALIPGLTHTEGIHGARLHVGHHLGGRNHHQAGVLVGIDAVSGQPVAHPEVVGAAREGDSRLELTAGGAALGDVFREGKILQGELLIKELLGERDRLAIHIKTGQDIHRHRLLALADRPCGQQVGHRR